MSETLTVLEALEKYPNSKSRAFHLNGDYSSVYFIVEDPIMVNSSSENGLQSYAKAIKLIIQTGQVLYTKVYIKKNDNLDAITFARFKELLDEGLALLKESKNNHHIKSQALGVYETIGYFK